MVNNEIKIEITKNQKEIVKAMEIRRQVFVVGQGVDENLDFDGKDSEAEHIVAYSNDLPIGTLRIRFLDKETAKLERLAVLQNQRRNGIGKKIMDYAIDYLRKKGIKKIKINSQEYIKNFYQKLGFEQKGEIFQEAGISHVEMWKNLQNESGVCRI